MSDFDSIVSPTLHTALLGAGERFINRALEYDPATRDKLTALAGHVFLIQCTEPSISVYLIPEPDTIRLCGVYEHKANTTLKGSAAEFAKLMTAADPASALINGDLELHGDSQALIELQKILATLDVDWEAPIAERFGDIVGHQIGRGLRGAFNFGKQALSAMRQQVSTMAEQDEALFTARPAAEQFFKEVDSLSMRTERLEAQLNKLKQALADKNAPSSEN